MIVVPCDAANAGGIYCRRMEQMSVTRSSNSRPLPPAISADFIDLLRQHQVIAAYLFGSIARGDERPESDIDLLVSFAVPHTLFEQIGLAEELSRVSGRRVDLMTKIDPAFEPFITPTLIPIPLV